MLEIKLKHIEIKINNEIIKIPLNNFSTSVAFKLSDLHKRREQLSEKLNQENYEENSKLAVDLLEEMLAAIIYEYPKYKNITDLIPMNNFEEFMVECINIMNDTDKKKAINTEAKLVKSKTESDSLKKVSRKKR